MSQLTEMAQNLPTSRVIELMTDLGATQHMETNNAVIFPTICHNHDADDASMKLYYYPKTHTFHCYTDCGCTFNIFEMFKKRYELLGESYDFYKDIVLKIEPSPIKRKREEFVKKYETIYEQPNYDAEVHMPHINKGILNMYNFYPTPEWLNDGISEEAMRHYNILYSISDNKIIIPHYDKDGNPVFNADGTPVKNRILSVPSYKEAFPDSQSVQYAAACKWGVKSVQNREEAESRKRELVYVGSNPYYFVDKMNRSIPYLVPRAAVLLNDIGRAFFDSLQMKQVPLHKVIVTSVLRTKDDVAKLRNYNHNATENSCHLYGTTFDICYNRYKTIQDPKGPKRRQVQNDTLKWVLSEVLNDMRQNKRCYVKYEVKQGCYHITVR